MLRKRKAITLLSPAWRFTLLSGELSGTPDSVRLSGWSKQAFDAVKAADEYDYSAAGDRLWGGARRRTRGRGGGASLHAVLAYWPCAGWARLSAVARGVSAAARAGVVTVSEGHRRLAEACESAAARQQRIKAAVAERIREINHQVRLETIRRDGAEAVAHIKAQQASTRRGEERLSMSLLDLQLENARARGEVPFDLLEKWHLMHVEATSTTPPDERAHLPLWQHEIARLARELQIEVSMAATPGANVYAWAGLKQIEIAPITSAFGYTSALHELGHCARPCDATHRRAAMAGGKTCCVQCEMEAWRWSIAQAKPTWTKGMHRHLAPALSSYRRYGTVAEQSAIDDLVSDRGLFRAQLARLETNQ